jgi:hypothetical protein
MLLSSDKLSRIQSYKNGHSSCKRHVRSKDSNEISINSIFDKDTFREFTEKKFNSLFQHENIDQIMKMRESTIEKKHKNQMSLIQ